MNPRKKFQEETGLTEPLRPLSITFYVQWLEKWINDMTTGMDYVGKWYKVEEKLPEPEFWLLVITKDRMFTLAKYIESRNNWAFKKRWVFHGMKFPIDDVVAWTYLPSIPDEYKTKQP